jgi:hypothetical protein
MNKIHNTEKTKKYVEARALGNSQERSALMAGYQDPGEGKKLEKKPNISEELARIRAETATNTGITREDVVGMLVDAGGMARIIGDVTGLVAAARELGKILGYYAPEVKKTLHGVDKATLKAALEELSDDELHKLAQARVIEGDFVRMLDGPKQ